VQVSPITLLTLALKERAEMKEDITNSTSSSNTIEARGTLLVVAAATVVSREEEGGKAGVGRDVGWGCLTLAEYG
jgi:myo-inositol catabolism protein IolC